MVKAKIEVEAERVEERESWPEKAEESSREEQGTSQFRERRSARIVLVLIIAIGLAAGTYAWHYYSNRESTDDAQTDGHIVYVSARVSGTVMSVNVKDNEWVKGGQVLVQLDPRDYEVAVARARAELADVEAAASAARTSVPIASTTTSSTLATANASLAAARQQVAAAEARAREAEANFTRVSADLKRAQQLIQKDEISRQQYDAALATEQAARASVDASRAAVDSAHAQVAQAEAQVRSAQTAPQQLAVTRDRASSAEAAVERAKAALQQAELNLQYTTVKAPFDGVINKRGLEPGQVVQPGQPLVSVVSLDDIWVIANFKETQLKDIRPGQPVTIHVDAYDRKYKGHVDSIGAATGARFSLLPPENATGNYVKVVQRLPVKILFEKGQDPDHILRPGMSVVPTVFTRRGEQQQP